MSFTETGLNPSLCRTCDGLGMKKTTPVQKATIPLILQGKQVCASACTGSGKTAAFVLPILHTLAQDPYGTYALIVTPSRELALQIDKTVGTFGLQLNVRHALLVGGMGMPQQAKLIRQRAHIVTGTPGRVFGVLEGPECQLVFKKLKYLVLDEADALLKDEFIEQIERICYLLPNSRTNLFFSATIDDDVKERIKRITKRPVEFVAVGSVALPPGQLEERCLWIPYVLFYPYLYYILDPKVIRATSVIVFTISCKKTELVRMALSELGVSVTSISGNIPQQRRFANLDQFRAGKKRVLVATDLASRGLDLPTVDLVINFDLPNTPEDYVHRVGRTARAGRNGIAVTFMLYSQKSIDHLTRIEKFTHGNFREYKLDEEKVSENLSKVTQARLAAEKKYAEIYGQNEDEAKRLAEIEAQFEDTEAAKATPSSRGKTKRSRNKPSSQKKKKKQKISEES